MPTRVVVNGRLTWNGTPIQGTVRFTPKRLWVIDQGIAWACLAPEVELDADGCFVVYLTPTDTDEVWWTYLVEAPGGQYEISVRKGKDKYTLRELVDEHHPRPRSAD